MRGTVIPVKQRPCSLHPLWFETWIVTYEISIPVQHGGFSMKCCVSALVLRAASGQVNVPPL